MGKNPLTGEENKSTRRALQINYELALRDEYADWVTGMIPQENESEEKGKGQ